MKLEKECLLATFLFATGVAISVFATILLNPWLAIFTVFFIGGYFAFAQTYTSSKKGLLIEEKVEANQ